MGNPRNVTPSEGGSQPVSAEKERHWEHVLQPIDCIRWKKSSGSVGLVTNQRNMYPSKDYVPFPFILSF